MTFRPILSALAGALVAVVANPPSGQSEETRLRTALAAAESGQFDAAQHTHLTSHPLYSWVEYAALKSNLSTLSSHQVEDFLRRYRGQAVAEALREPWLELLATRQDWPAFRNAWQSGIKSPKLRCAQWQAQLANGDNASWIGDAQSLWRSSGKSLPNECDPVFAAMDASGNLTNGLRWERIDVAAAARQPGVMRNAARGLSASEQTLAEDYADFIQGVHPRASHWPKTTRSQMIASHGLARLAKSSPAAAEAQLPIYAAALGMNDVDRGRVLYEIALQTASSYEPDYARRLNAVPEAAYDNRLYELRVREALARSDWRAALTAIRKMPPKLREDSHWRYYEARLLEVTGNARAAQPLYRVAAKDASFHGFLAADKLNLPYALCPWQPSITAAEATQVTRDPALVRAMALYRLDRRDWALREWNEAMTRFDQNQRLHAVAIAQQNGWYDRTVFSLGNSTGRPEELRLYELRFPLHHSETIRRESTRNRLDPAWVAAEIRAESAFDPNARSTANALGLMQVLPGTGAQVAKRLGMRWNGANSLYDPEINIILGTAYLRQMLDRYVQPHYAIAAYNAGPTPLARWQSQRPNMDMDFWIETISYKETREYVARVLAFSTLYDWRLQGDARRMSDRMLGIVDGPRKGFACPLAEISPPATAKPSLRERRRR